MVKNIDQTTCIVSVDEYTTTREDQFFYHCQLAINAASSLRKNKVILQLVVAITLQFQ